MHVGSAIVFGVVPIEFHIGAKGQIAEPGVRRYDGISKVLGQVQRDVGRFLRHMIDVDDQTAPHHLLQQDDTVLVETARIGVAAAHRGMIQRLKQIAHAWHLMNKRLPVHSWLRRRQ